MHRFWQNPEMIRHVRAGLRGSRAWTIGILVCVLCFLLGLVCWLSIQEFNVKFFLFFYIVTLAVQFLGVGGTCAFRLGDTIVRERELKTFDFQITTRMTAAELMVGKILGVPFVAYFAVGCSLPFSFAAGLLGGFSFLALLQTYFLLLLLAVQTSLVALWISMQIEKRRQGGQGLLALMPHFFFVMGPYTVLPGLVCISVFAPLMNLIIPNEVANKWNPTFFGTEIPILLLTLVIYFALGAWFVLMVVRNLKKQLENIRLLSRWQSLGFAIFLNVLFYVLLDPRSLEAEISPSTVATIVVFLNGILWYLLGFANLTRHEKLKGWLRRRASGIKKYFAEDGLPWPWIVVTAAASYLLLAVEAFSFRESIPFDEWRLGRAGVQALTIVVFAVRDILFLQCCLLMKMKSPVGSGTFFLALYYIACLLGSLAIKTVSAAGAEVFVWLFVPYPVLLGDLSGLSEAPYFYIGLLLQMGIAAFLLFAISRYLTHSEAKLAGGAVS